jgi:hypothetical protein
MIKKLVFLTAMVIGGIAVFNSFKPGAVSVWGNRIKHRLERKLSPEFELARIRDQIKELTPDMHKHIGKIADEMVQVEALEKRVGEAQVKLAGMKQEVTAMTTALEHGEKGYVSYTGRTVPLTPVQVRKKLREYQESERSVESQKKMLEARKQSLESARQQLVEIKRQKEELELYVTEFQAKIDELKLEQTRSKVALDDSRLAEIKESLEKLQQRVEAERIKANLTKEFVGTGVAKPEKTSATAEDVIAEVHDYFGDANADKK